MALTVSFGNGGNSLSTTIFDAEQQTGGRAIDETTRVNTTDSPSGETIVPGSTVVGSVSVPPANNGGVNGTGLGGTVNYGVTDGAFSFDVAGAYNTVKNATVALTGDAHGEDVSFSDFVHVDVNFSNAYSASSVTVENVKRVNVETGKGNDTIDITLTSNTNDWQNIANVKSGAGNDTITISTGQGLGGKAIITDGRYTTSTVDGGDGNDTIDLTGLKLLKSMITGGAGNDTMTGNLNSDTYVYGAAKAGSDTITNFEISGPQRDHLQLATGVSIVSVDYDAGTNSTTATLSNKTTIEFLNLSASQADLLG